MTHIYPGTREDWLTSVQLTRHDDPNDYEALAAAHEADQERADDMRRDGEEW